MAGLLRVEIHNGVRNFFPEGTRDPDYHEWAGPIILDQTRTGLRLGFNLSGSYRSKGLLVSGNVKDGPGGNTNRLTLQSYAVPVIRLSGSNTYANGTLVDYSPSAPQAWVEVAPESSLGRGDVEVRGVLRLMGNRNLNPYAGVTIPNGRVILDSGLKARLSRLTFSPFGTVYTVGLFTQTNGQQRLWSNGTLRLPAVNLSPSISITNPVNGAALSAADPLRIRARATDLDSYIERVDFYLNGTLAGTLTNPPFNLSISNAPMGDHALHAVIYDDDGASSASPVVNVRIAPRIDSIRHLDTNVIAIEFRTPPEQALELQASDSLSPPVWMTLGSFSAASVTTTNIVTNSIPAEVPTRYYRLRTPN